jgi:TolA-binding protein
MGHFAPSRWASLGAWALLLFPAVVSAEIDPDTRLSAMIPALAESLAQGKYSDVLERGMPLYRSLAQREYHLEGIRQFAENIVLINRAATQTAAALQRGVASQRGPDVGETMDSATFCRSLLAFGRVQEVSSEGLTEDELQVLVLLYTATWRQGQQRILASSDDPSSPLTGEYLFAYALAALQPNDHAALLETLPAHTRSPDSAQRLAEFCARVDRKDAAAGVFTEMAKILPDAVEAAALADRATGWLVEGGEVAKAIEVQRGLVSRFPESPEAEEAQLRVIDLTLEHWKAYATAAEECRAFVRLFPYSKRRTATALRAAHLEYQDHNHQSAIAYLEEIRKDPEIAKARPQILFIEALCRVGLGENEPAMDLLRTICVEHELNPLAPRASRLLAHMYLSRQEYDKARAELKRLLTKYPTTDEARRCEEDFKKLSRSMKSMD